VEHTGASDHKCKRRWSLDEYRTIEYVHCTGTLSGAVEGLRRAARDAVHGDDLARSGWRG
jgi:hypothetical protein